MSEAKVAVVTGASSGIGRASAIGLAKAGTACLSFKGDPARAEAALEWLVTPEWFE